MPTTILDGESYEQAKARRFSEEAAIEARRCPQCGSSDTTEKHHQGDLRAPECYYRECNCCAAQWGHE